MNKPIRILLQTTIPAIEDDWLRPTACWLPTTTQDDDGGRSGSPT